MSSNIISTLRETFAECVCTSCEEPGCKLKFKNVPKKKVILSIDCIAKCHPIQGKRCDYIITVMDGQSIFFIPVEFKTNRVVVQDITEQLGGGMDFIQQYCPDQFVCYPVLVSKSISRSASKALQKAKIRYNGRTARIRRISCNQSLQWNNVKKKS